MITHDLGVVAGICDKVLVMYAGRTMEYGNARDVFYQPVASLFYRFAQRGAASRCGR